MAISNLNLPALLNAFCEQCGIEPRWGDHVGDTVSDMEFGRNAGASNVGVLTQGLHNTAS